MTKTATRPQKTRFARYDDMPGSYRELCALHLPRPVHDAAGAREATAMLEAMAGFPLNPEQSDYLEAVAHFLDEHDRATERPLPAAGATEVLTHLLEEHDLTAADLSRLLGGSRNLGAMILRGDRNLTLAHIRKLSAHFHVSPEVFI